MANELDKPLGRKKMRRPNPEAIIHFARGFPVARTAIALLVVLVGVVGFRIAFVNDPDGGRPAVETGLGTPNATQATLGASSSIPPSTGAQSAKESLPIAGDAQTVTPDASATGDQGPEITIVGNNVPDAAAGAGGRADTAAAGARLTEKTRYGDIPRVAADGQTPFAAFSRAGSGAADAGGKPMVAIVMTGLGLDRTGTLGAIKALPSSVTLAFAPYGAALGPTVAAARRSGHEMLLELPMEPFDYPQSDPGPKTLLADQPPRANLDRLFWLLARFKGYMGVMNYMGARFTASAADFQPIIEELGTRGLGYFDDGTSNRSLAPQMARANKIPFARASVDIDASPARADILAALASLETEARDNGSAIGIASALPVTIDTIVQWADGLKDKGIVLVPASTLMKPS